MFIPDSAWGLPLSKALGFDPCPYFFDSLVVLFVAGIYSEGIVFTIISSGISNNYNKIYSFYLNRVNIFLTIFKLLWMNDTEYY
jgi:hypothetical protein